MTISEQMFEKLCYARGILFKRIDPRTNSRTADYKIWINSTEVVVEVKQIDKSNHENQLESGAENDDSPFIISDIVTRIRNKFDKAKKQLKESSHGCLPAILVLFDNTGGLSGMNNEDFLNAMYGDEIVQFHIKTQMLKTINQKATHHFGGQKKLDRYIINLLVGFVECSLMIKVNLFSFYFTTRMQISD